MTATHAALHGVATSASSHDWLMTSAAYILPIGTITGLAILSPFVIKAYAERDIFYTLCPENIGKIVVRGENTFVHAILSSNTMHLNDPRKPWHDKSIRDWEVLPNLPNVNYDDRWWMVKKAGAYWVGIPGLDYVYSYPFKWSEYDKSENPDKKYDDRSEKTVFWYAKDFPYIVKLDELKTRDLVQTQTISALTVAITNPYRALFKTDDWLTQVTTAVNEALREFVGKHDFQELVSSKGDAVTGPTSFAKDNFNTCALAINAALSEEYGVTIKSLKVEEFDMTGAMAEANERASLLNFEAENEAKATATKAEGQAKATRTIADAEAYRIITTATAQANGAAKQLAAYAKEPELAMGMLVADAAKTPAEGKSMIILPTSLTDALSSGIAGIRKK